MHSIIEHAATIDAALRGIMAELTCELDQAAMLKILPEIQQLEGVLHLKSLIDARVAYLIEHTNAGDACGTASPIECLKELFGLSGQEALRRLRLGQLNHEDIDADAAVVRQETLQSQAATPISAEKAHVIVGELRNLDSTDSGVRVHLHGEAVAEARNRGPEDLRTWLRHRVNRANRTHPDPAARRQKRHLTFGPEDRYGGGSIRIYATAEQRALFISALAPARHSEPAGRTVDGSRSLGARRIDMLCGIVHRHLSEQARDRKGIGSILLSVTAEDLAALQEPGGQLHRIPTNTGVALTLQEFLNLGLAQWDVGVLHDPATGAPLRCGRLARSAGLAQRLALVASELVCSHPGCSQPATDCDVHHLRAWVHGGETNIDNLTLLCRRHHTDNNDARAGQRPRGWAERDPHTGRVGWQPPDPADQVRLNDSAAQQKSAGERIRRRERGSGGPPAESA